MSSMNTLADWLAHCERLHPQTIDLGLERVRTVAQRMDLRLDCSVITVAGTNGKGSTCAMLESILRQAGYRTGVYTSPHLVQFEERLRLDGEMVQAAQLLPSFARVEQARLLGGPVSLSYFEFTTLAILDWTWRYWKSGWAGGSMRSTSSMPTAPSSPASTWITWSCWGRTAST